MTRSVAMGKAWCELTRSASLDAILAHPHSAGGSWEGDQWQRRAHGRESTPEPAAGLAEFRRHLTDTTRPPGPAEAMLGEIVVHAEDIRRPLGITHKYPPEALTRVTDFFKGSNLLIGGKRRIAGLTLRATDTGWTTGTGPEVTGPHLSLLLAMTGRSAALADLSGDGLATLRSRA